jgi:4-hydroxybenzoate polyprenyltransferase
MVDMFSQLSVTSWSSFIRFYLIAGFLSSRSFCFCFHVHSPVSFPCTLRPLKHTSSLPIDPSLQRYRCEGFLDTEKLWASTAGGVSPDNVRSGPVSNDKTGVVSSIVIPAQLPTIWSSRKELFHMTRPNNIPGIILFHMLGVYLVMVQVASNTHTYWSLLLKEPVIWLTLLSTNLVSASSMVVNDYYDAKLGRDTLKQMNSDGGDANQEKWMLHKDNGLWNKLVTRRFLMYLYSIALCISNCLPGIPTRLSVTVALMMTYLYTVHLKPMTWVKNIVCATLIALAPWTSGSCALYLLQQHGNKIALNGVWSIPALWRLFGVLFFGVFGRELLMDCADVDADRATGIRTIPVVYGCSTASKVALASAIVMTYFAMVAPITQLLLLPSFVPIWSSTPMRRLFFAVAACGLQLRGMWSAVQTNGADRVSIDKVISQSLFTVVFLMASFV